MANNKKILCSLMGTIITLANIIIPYGAAAAFTLTPQSQEYALTLGQSVTGEVSAVNPYNAEGDFYYVAEVVPYSVSDDGEYLPSFDARGDYTDIINWVTLSDDDEFNEATIHGVLKPGETGKIYYTINVPQDARGGGQYFAVRVKNDVDAAQESEDENTATIKEVVGIASLIFAEVAGDITIKGEITDNNIQSFFLKPPINASFMIKNEGNTHALVKYFLQVFPLFSDEEIYTTEENPGSNYVLPGSTRMITQTWDDTPQIGIFKVRQTVFYDSTSSEPSVTEKIVIICPIWLIFIIIFAIVALIIWLVLRAKSRRKRED